MSEAEQVVVLRMGDTKFIVSVKTAIQVMNILTQDNVREWKKDYEKDEATGQWGYVERIVPCDTERLAIQYLSPGRYLQYVMQGDKS